MPGDYRVPRTVENGIIYSPNPKGWGMIKLTRLNNSLIVVNAELIEFIESTPDTMITLTTGQKIIVLEGVDDVMKKVKEYRRSLLEGIRGD
jgi:flagellar protein FlbD